MSIIYEPHVCDKPPANTRVELDPIYARGTIWQCDDCGRHWWAERFSGMGFWYRVRFWNLCLKHHIRKATR